MLHIFTLSWNGVDKLENLKPGLLKNLESLNVPWTWHIKDNGSIDSSISAVKAWDNKNIIIYNYPNNTQSYSEGMNYLAEQANAKPGDFILFLNNDITFNDKNSLVKMKAIIDKDKTVGIVGAKLNYTGTDLAQHVGVVFVGNQWSSPTHLKLGKKITMDESLDREFQCVTGAISLMRAEDFQAIHGFDNDFRWAFDDVSLCLKIKYDLNKKVIYCGSTNIAHEESASLKKNPVNKLHMNHNLSTFAKKWKHRVEVDEHKYNSDKKYKLYVAKK